MDKGGRRLYLETEERRAIALECASLVVTPLGKPIFSSDEDRVLTIASKFDLWLRTGKTP